MRREDWTERLWAELEAKREQPFFYGACVDLAARVVDAMTGSNWAAEIAPLYTDEAAARELIAGGVDALEALVTARLGDPVPMNFAYRGDPVLLQVEGGPALGVCTGDQIAVPTDRGLLYRRRRIGLKAWRVL